MKSSLKIFKPSFVAGVFFCFLFLKSSACLAINPVWQIDIGSGQPPNSYYAEIDNDGNLYITREGKLLKISDSGEKLWEYEIPQKYQRRISGSPKIAGDFVVITSGYFGGYAYFINRQNGALVAEHELFDPNLLGKLPYFYSKPQVSQDASKLYIYFTYPEYIFGFNTNSGDLFGKKLIGQGVGGPSYAPQVTSISDISYVGTLNGSAYSFFPYSIVNSKQEGNMELLNFSKDPSPSTTESINILGPAIDYKRRLLYFFDKQLTSKSPGIAVLNLGDGTLLKTIPFPTGYDSKSPPILDRFGNIFQIVYDQNPTKKNHLLKISPAGEVVSDHEFPTNITAFVGVILDTQGNIYTAVDKFYKFSNSLDEIYSYDMGSSGAGMAPTLQSDFSNVYIVSKNGILFKFATNFQNPGCVRDYYCQSTPKHNPVIFIHGLGGKDTDWMSGNKAKMRNLILEEYRKDDPEFPDSWAFAYHYGYDDWGKYNYQGDIQSIAKGLQEDVARLSWESKEAGGSGKVDLVGFSLGGQVIREYFAQMVRKPDTTADDRPHKVDNAIIIASPNKGSSYLELRNYIGSIPNLLVSTTGNAILSLTNDNDQPINVNSIAMGQLKSGSEFYKRVSERKATDVNYYTLYGDIGITNRIDFFGVSVGGRATIGDGLIEATSGSGIPGIITKGSYAFGDNIGIEAKLAIKNTYAGFEIQEPNILTSGRYLHRALIEQPEVRNKVLEILISN